MLETVRKTLGNREKFLPALSDEPTAEELQQLLETNETVASGFFKDVYETEHNVVKLPSYAGAMEGAETQIDNVKGIDIAPETNVEFYDLRASGYLSKTPVVLQEKYDSTLADLPISEVDRFVDEAITIIDTALLNDVVLQDAKIDNFGLFDDEVKYIDIADKESLVAFNPPEDRSQAEKRAFLGNTSSMYDAFTRTVSRQTDYSRDQVVDYVTQYSTALDEDIEIELPDASLKTGLEQRLTCEVTGNPESTY